MSAYNVSGSSIDNFYDIAGSLKNALYDSHGVLVVSSEYEFLDNTIVTTVYSNPSLDEIAEGGCIADDSTVYVCFPEGIFAKYDLRSGIETQYTFTSGAYGHANDMTYNPNTGYLYIAGMKNTGEVYVLDKSTNLVDTLYAKDANGIPFNCWNIAYNRLTRQFITMHQGVIYFFNDSFQLVDTASYNVEEWTDTRQNIETDGKYVYCVSDNPLYIYVFTMDGERVKSISNSNYMGEPESLMYDWETDLFYLETWAFTIDLVEFRKNVVR